ncbi:unnamed protein product [Coccothraustes coccothraustes]
MGGWLLKSGMPQDASQRQGGSSAKSGWFERGKCLPRNDSEKQGMPQDASQRLGGSRSKSGWFERAKCLPPSDSEKQGG